MKWIEGLLEVKANVGITILHAQYGTSDSRDKSHGAIELTPYYQVDNLQLDVGVDFGCALTPRALGEIVVDCTKGLLVCQSIEWWIFQLLLACHWMSDELGIGIKI